MSLQEVVSRLGDYAEVAYKGRNPSRRRTASEGLCDLMPADFMEYAFGEAFKTWNGAKLAWLVENMPARYIPEFLQVATKRLVVIRPTSKDKVGLMELDALLGILKIAKRRSPIHGAEVDRLVTPLQPLIEQLEW